MKTLGIILGLFILASCGGSEQSQNENLESADSALVQEEIQVYDSVSKKTDEAIENIEKSTEELEKALEELEN